MTLREQNRINELLFRLLDNEISDEGLAQLRSWLASDPRAKAYYCRFMEDYSGLVLRATTVIEETWPEEDNVLSDLFWSRLSEEERLSPGLPACRAEAEETPPRDLLKRVEYERPPQTINKFSLAAAILCAAALVMMIVYVHLSGPVTAEVATVADALDAQWSSRRPLSEGTRLGPGTEPIRLTRGIVKFVTDNNVEVVLEAPTEFQFVSYSEIALTYGKLYARVSEQGHGFSVATPNSRIVDLGTAFGVLSHIDGDTEVYMYEGKANLLAGQKDENKMSELLTAGTARRVKNENSRVEPIAMEEHAVVRAIDSQTGFAWKGRPLSLADLVGGGRGFGGGQLNTGVETLTGRAAAGPASIDPIRATAGFRRVDIAGIDGVFVPEGEGQATAIASDPAVTAVFPETSGYLWGTIFNGAFHEGMTTPRHALRLDGHVFGTRENPAITIHSNQGITFDLAAIRQDLGGLTIRRFQAVAGVSETVQEALRREQGRSFEGFTEVKRVFDAGCAKAEFWVLADGKVVFHQVLSSADGGAAVDVPLTGRERFLTLAVTEADDTHAYDWALFGRPELGLEAGE